MVFLHRTKTMRCTRPPLLRIDASLMHNNVKRFYYINSVIIIAGIKTPIRQLKLNKKKTTTNLVKYRWFAKYHNNNLKLPSPKFVKTKRGQKLFILSSRASTSLRQLRIACIQNGQNGLSVMHNVETPKVGKILRRRRRGATGCVGFV